MRRVRETDHRVWAMLRSIDEALEKAGDTIENVVKKLRVSLSDEATWCVGRELPPEEIRARIRSIVRDITANTWTTDADDSAVRTWLSASGQSMLIAEVVKAIIECCKAYEDAGE